MYNAKTIKSHMSNLPPGNVRFHQSQHVHRGLVELDEDAIVDLSQTEQLKDLSYPGTHAIDTARSRYATSHVILYVYTCHSVLSSPFDSDDKGQLGLIRNVEVLGLLCLPPQSYLISLLLTVLLHVTLSTLEDVLSLVLP